jgi:hypothetical protein
MKNNGRFLKLAAIVAVLCLLPVAASANTIVQNLTFGMLLTNWNNFTNLPVQTPAGAIMQFNSTLGALDKVTIQFDSMVAGTIKMENLDLTAGATMTGTLQAMMQMFAPSLAPVTMTPTDTRTFVSPQYDGSTDWGGSSGITYGAPPAYILSAVSSTTSVITGAGVAPYASATPGQVSFFVQATGTSTASGGGNMASAFTTRADASVTVTYDWHDTKIPEPMSMVLIGSGLLGLGYLGRKRLTR